MEYKEFKIYQIPEEVEIIRQQVRETKDVPGDIVEVGVFEGASCAIIREESDKELWMFDTFAGFPDKLDASDSPNYFIGDCAATEDKLKEHFKNDKKAHIIKGVFPETGGVLKDKKFSLVHIDVDIYLSTKESLQFFLGRMNPGGIILIHDYPAHPGVKKAVQELGLQVELLGTFGRQARIKF